ncbi:MAG: vitamin B12 dependent-methionine synthase activation domain-containing protein, partial [Acidobacteriota bacterium]
PQMLYAKHLGLKGSVRRLRESDDPKLAMLEGVVRELQEAAESNGVRARAVWRFFPARAEGERVILLDPEDPEGRPPVAEWTFPRQADGDRLCLADYVLSGNGGEPDHVALFVTTFGGLDGGVRETAERWKRDGEYLKSHAYAALALETAEAAAEYLHRKLRERWGFPDEPADDPDEDRQALFQTRYRGKRYSFGYPACPDLEGQRELFEALQPEEIGVELTEGDMMDPEASVSALVFHHPDARYFGT